MTTTIEGAQAELDLIRFMYFNGAAGLATSIKHLRIYFGHPIGEVTDQEVKRFWLLAIRPYLRGCKPPENIRWGYNGGCECPDRQTRATKHSFTPKIEKVLEN